ncbi:hypothetical protein [Aminipila sp.]|nr:hypothetical protein [Aminipila sp.]
MKGFIFTCIGLGVIAAVFIVISGPLFNTGSEVMTNTATASVMIP